MAARTYLARGYRVEDRNWSCPGGELDLVVSKADLVVFCEVKARSGGRYGSPEEAVSPAKQRRVRKTAGLWLSRHPTSRRREIRFDVAAVNFGRITIIEEAF